MKRETVSFQSRYTCEIYWGASDDFEILVLLMNDWEQKLNSFHFCPNRTFTQHKDSIRAFNEVDDDVSTFICPFITVVQGRCTLGDVMREFRMNGSDTSYVPDDEFWTPSTGNLVTIIDLAITGRYMSNCGIFIVKYLLLQNKVCLSLKIEYKLIENKRMNDRVQDTILFYNKWVVANLKVCCFRQSLT